MTTKGNNRNHTCNGAYKGSLNVGAETRGGDVKKEPTKDDSGWMDGWMDGSGVSFLMPHSTRHRVALTTVKLLLSSKLWRLSP